MKFAMTVFALLASTAAAHAVDWNLRRATTSGTCHVQTVDSRPQLGDRLSTHPTRLAACKDAKARNSDDMDDATKCQEYTPGARADCKRDGVELPK